MPDTTGDKHVDAVIEKHAARVHKGIAKYGMTLDTNPAEVSERLTHIQEEAMDAAAYCEWAKDAYAKELNKLADIEWVMLDAAHGKRPMPTPLQLRMWALMLGTPRERWTDAMKKELSNV